MLNICIQLPTLNSMNTIFDRQNIDREIITGILHENTYTYSSGTCIVHLRLRADNQSNIKGLCTDAVLIANKSSGKSLNIILYITVNIA